MGFFDRLTGTRRPGPGRPPQPAGALRTALLGLNGPDVPYLVRDGADEGADLVAEWRLTEPAWQSFFRERELSRRIRIRMRLVPAEREVRALDEQWKVVWIDGVPISSAYGRGPVKTTSRHWTVGRGEEGRFEMTETFRFDSSDLKEPLRDTVLEAGWTWRGVVFGRP